MGATSGIGEALCHLFVGAGWKVGIAGRREERLIEIQETAPQQISYAVIDICKNKATDELASFINNLGGIDYYLHVSGIGFQNKELNLTTELNTIDTNITGFTRMVDTVFNYMKENGGGHIGIISSVAGSKALGTAPAYSATKCFNNRYIQALTQLSRMNQHNISFTTIKPGFVRTAILNPEKHYPMLMSKDYASQLIFKALLHKKRSKIIDWRYAILVGLLQLIPNVIWERLRITN
jgi:short-subunit dehydrogenase